MTRQVAPVLDPVCQQILDLWDDLGFESALLILDYGEIAEITGLDILDVTTACRKLIDEGYLSVVGVEEP